MVVLKKYTARRPALRTDGARGCTEAEACMLLGIA